MSIQVECACGRMFKAKEEHAGLRAKCPSCGVVLEIPKLRPDSVHMPDEITVNDLREGVNEDSLGIKSDATLADVLKALNAILAQVSAPPAASSPSPNRLYEYKVITQKDKWFSGKFDPEKVEGALNSYAKQGWSLKGVATASVPGFGGQREEIVIIMER